jgi:hypothetical protein
VGLKLNGTHQLMVCANDIILMGDGVPHKENKETLIDISWKVGPEVYPEKIMDMVLSGD